MKITALEALSLGVKNNSNSLPMDAYHSVVNKHIEETIDFFPCLTKIVHSCKVLPDNSLWLTYAVKGVLVTSEELKQRGIKPSDAKKYFDNYFNIYCIIPHTYKSVGCLVCDSNCFIKWERLPEEHCHINRKSTKYGNLLCTHLYVEAKDMNNPVLENLKTAHDLAKAYVHYLKSKEWTLQEYNHGKEGEREYYENRRLQNGVK